MIEKNHHGDGFYYGYSPSEGLDDNGKPILIDTKNVIGRFKDHQIVDGVASKEQKKRVYKPAILLETKLLQNSFGQDLDTSSHSIRFGTMSQREASAAHIERFPEAWEQYQAERKCPISEDEEDAGRELGFKSSVKAVKKPRQRRRSRKKATQTPANVIKLQNEG